MMYYNVTLIIELARSRCGVVLLVSVVLLMFLQGCSTRAWYEGFRERERSRCYQYRTTDEIDSCLEQVDSMSYERYRRSRQDELPP